MGHRLAEEYDLTMLDLDGVVYIGGQAVPGAPGFLDQAREVGTRLAFVTNNAARPPAVVAAHLRELGVRAEDADVVTSAQAAAHLVRSRFGAGATIAVLGGEGLQQALLAEGLVTAPVDAENAVALVSGFGPEVAWREVVRAGTRIAAGLPWVAANRDLTFPTDAGLGPGHGALVELLERFSGRVADVAGKPSRHLLDETVRRMASRKALMVGDRLDTDIECAHRAGHDSLLVLTGVSGLADLIAAPPMQRPTYLAADLGGLLEPHPAPELRGDYAELGGWRARVVRGRLEVAGDGAPDDWWRVAVSAAWRWQDRYAEVADAADCRPPLPR